MSTARATCWSVTINNPTAADEEYIATARQKGWKVDGQLEQGAQGTKHYQLIVKTPQVRFSAVKKAFPRAHIEAARNPTALAKYCDKDDTKIGELKTESKFYPSLSKFWHLVFEHIETRNWIHFDGNKWYKTAFEDLAFDMAHYDAYDDDPAAHRELGQRLALAALEHAVGRLIAQGYHIEHFYSPPNISIFKKFHFDVIHRSRTEISAQTEDSQTDTDSTNPFSDIELAIENATSLQIPTFAPPPPSDDAPPPSV